MLEIGCQQKRRDKISDRKCFRVDEMCGQLLILFCFICPFYFLFSRTGKVLGFKVIEVR